MDGEDSDVAVVVEASGRLWERLCEWAGGDDVEFGPSDLLGHFAGGDVGSAEVPSALDGEGQFEVEAVGFGDGVDEQFPPRFGAVQGASGDALVSALARPVCVEDESAAHAFVAHFFEVTGDCIFGDVAVEPPPEASGSGFEGWVVPAGFEGEVLAEGGCEA